MLQVPTNPTKFLPLKPHSGHFYRKGQWKKRRKPTDLRHKNQAINNQIKICATSKCYSKNKEKEKWVRKLPKFVQESRVSSASGSLDSGVTCFQS